MSSFSSNANRAFRIVTISAAIAASIGASRVEAASTPIPKVICAHKISGALALRNKCKSSETKISNRAMLVGLTGSAGATGATGAAGPAGADGATGPAGNDGAAGSMGATGANGSLRIYGDGSRGALFVTSGTTTITDNKNQFSSIAISVGATLSVPSGTVIRCTGTFTNDGSVIVAANASGGFGTAMGAHILTRSSYLAAPGLSGVSAPTGAYGGNSGTLAGGSSPNGISEASANQLTHLGPVGGGGGGAGLGGAFGGSGGGTITILSQQGIVNTGLIQAKGTSGASGGGGGGGVVLLASPTSISNSGTIDVSGGAGSASLFSVGACGGGGGGYVHMISPLNSTLGGVINIGGGAGGTGSGAATVTTTPRIAGSAGGASLGAGGSGGSVSAADDSTAGADGDPGAATLTISDPTSLF